MADDYGWLVIPRWAEFQHRDAGRSGQMPWIKNYTKLLSNDAYLDLTWQQRGLLHGLWMEYASSHGQVRVRPLSLSRRLGLRLRSSQLESLNHAGFIQFSASKPPALFQQRASTEKRREENLVEEADASSTTDGKDQSKRSKAQSKAFFLEPPSTSGVPDRANAAVQEVYDHWRSARGRTRSNYATISPQRRAKIKARLAEYTAAELCVAISNVANDPWPERPRHDDLTVILRSREQVDRFLEMTSSASLTNGNGKQHRRYGYGLTTREMLDLADEAERMGR